MIVYITVCVHINWSASLHINNIETAACLQTAEPRGTHAHQSVREGPEQGVVKETGDRGAGAKRGVEGGIEDQGVGAGKERTGVKGHEVEAERDVLEAEAGIEE